MEIPIVVEPTPQGLFRAQAPPPLTSVGEGPTIDLAMANLRLELNKELQGGKKIVMLDIDGGTGRLHPWLEMTGWLKDDPLFEEWQAIIKEYRGLCDREAGMEEESTSEL
jgi:hypothetical protein